MDNMEVDMVTMTLTKVAIDIQVMAPMQMNTIENTRTSAI